MNGIVKWFNRQKGYGFIQAPDVDDDIFVHYSAIDGEGYRNLNEGDRVTFKLVDVGKGPQARDVKRQRLTESERAELERRGLFG